MVPIPVRTRRIVSLFVLPLLFGLVLTSRAASDGSTAIRAEALKAHVEYLASDDLKGRGSGEKGNELAARYIADHFKKAGLKPLGTSRQSSADAKMDRSGYFQPFAIPIAVTSGRNNRLEAEVAGKRVRYKVNTEFAPSGVAMSGQAQGEVVYVGYGIQSQNPPRDDFAGANVSGKIVMFLAGAPTSDPHSPLSALGGIRRKARTARDLGAAAILVVLPKDSDAFQMNGDDGSSDAGLPILILRRNVARDWLKASGLSVPTADQLLSDPQSPRPLDVKVSLSADVQKVLKTTANVIGMLEGSDPTLKNEVVVIGAHMDHLGMGGPGSLAESRSPAIHHGADDNASGTAGVLELADYFAAMNPRPKRSLIFMAFSGEERGLLGSAHYIRNPLVPIDQTVTMINMDMIGRMQDNRLTVIGSGTSPAWNPLLEELNREARFNLLRNESGFGASDQQSFYLMKIPVLFFFTGLHADYHKPSDTADKINALDLARVVNYVADCAARVADTPARPAYVAVQTTPDNRTRTGLRASLGTMPEYSEEVQGVRFAAVREGGPADKAGLKAGDVLIKLAGKSILNVQDFTDVLGELKPGDEVEVIVKRGTETITVKATLTESRR